jgi:hypothetical protein
MNNKTNCYEVKFIDVSHKWLDNTKTTAELIFYDMLGRPMVLAYVHSDDTIEEARSNKEKYLDIMLKTIKDNVMFE